MLNTKIFVVFYTLFMVATNTVSFGITGNQSEKNAPGLHDTIGLSIIPNTTDNMPDSSLAYDNGAITISYTWMGTRLGRRPLYKCISMAASYIDHYLEAQRVGRKFGPGTEAIPSIKNSNVEIAAFMNGAGFPADVTWGDMSEALSQVKNVITETGRREAILIVASKRSHRFVVIAISPLQDSSGVSSIGAV